MVKLAVLQFFSLISDSLGSVIESIQWAWQLPKKFIKLDHVRKKADTNFYHIRSTLKAKQSHYNSLARKASS
jgi:hypothetical protein